MILQVKVKAGAKHAKVEQLDDGGLLVHVNAPPVDGQANAQLIRILADHFSVARSAISIQSGKTSKWKLIKIDDGD